VELDNNGLEALTTVFAGDGHDYIVSNGNDIIHAGAGNDRIRLGSSRATVYGGGGSKLKSTATEYIRMNEYWNNQGIQFIWVTDGAGWKSTLKPLREYFDKADYLLNLEMLRNGVLKRILK